MHGVGSYVASIKSLLFEKQGTDTTIANEPGRVTSQERTFQAKSSNQEQVSIQGHRYTKTRGAYAHCLLYASSAFRPGQASGIRSESTVIRSSFKVHVKVHGFQIKVHGFRASFKVQVKVSGFRSRSTVSGISKLDEQLLTCFCIFLVSIPSRSSFKVQVKIHGFQVKLQGSRQGPRFSDRGPRFQVKHQGSDQSPRLSGISKLDGHLLTCFCIFLVSIPSRSSFKVQVKVHGFQVKLQGSGQGPRFSGISKLDEQLLTCFCIFLVSIPSRSSFKVQVKVNDFQIKVHGFRSSFKVQVKVHGFQIKFHGFRYIKTRWAVTHLFLYISSVHSIQVKLQGSSQGPPFQGKLQGSGQGQRVQVEVHGFRRQGCDLPAKVIGITKHYGNILTGLNMFLVFSHPGQSTGF
ncbi:hypothetical protein HELRODRAFT_184199 [Helobdella robusta]|uniref:Uncharacterized protein n=1 Tax=Helobdella robusta TaxID=6412 RepID=T1FKR1_HELRO|nr:hypothetical protein HELRODRAFT_184199 [Helobdella robusta]ESO05452.1 hypothetical protein HELRODRAFT_184199 [Helobdella robusta]